MNSMLQPVGEFLMTLTKSLVEAEKDSVVFAAPFETPSGETLWIKYSLSIEEVLDEEGAAALKATAFESMHELLADDKKRKH